MLAQTVERARRRVARRRAAFLAALTVSIYSEEAGRKATLYTQALELLSRLRTEPVNIDAQQHNADWVKEVRRGDMGEAEGTARE